MKETTAQRVARMIREGREEQRRLADLRGETKDETKPGQKGVFVTRFPKPCHTGPIWLKRDKIKTLQRALAGVLSDSDRAKIEAKLREVQTHRDGKESV